MLNNMRICQDFYEINRAIAAPCYNRAYRYLKKGKTFEKFILPTFRKRNAPINIGIF